MPFRKALSRHCKVHLHEPHLVHEFGRRPPRLLVQCNIIAFKNDDALRRKDGNIIFLGILDGVVERRGEDGVRGVSSSNSSSRGGWMRRRKRRWRWWYGQGLFESLYEFEKGCAVKGEFGAAAGVGGGWVGHGGELGAGEVVAVHGDEGSDGGRVLWVLEGVSVVEGLCDDLGKGCFACWEMIMEGW